MPTRENSISNDCVKVTNVTECSNLDGGAYNTIEEKADRARICTT